MLFSDAVNKFIVDGHSEMQKILKKFVSSFSELYGDKTERFLGDEIAKGERK